MILRYFPTWILPSFLEQKLLNDSIFIHLQIINTCSWNYRSSTLYQLSSNTSLTLAFTSSYVAQVWIALIEIFGDAVVIALHKNYQLWLRGTRISPCEWCLLWYSEYQFGCAQGFILIPQLFLLIINNLLSSTFNSLLSFTWW